MTARELDIDFAGTGRAPAPAAWLLLAAGVALAGWTTWRYVGLADGIEAASMQRDSLQRRSSAVAERRPDPARQAAVDRSLRGARNIGAQIVRPWDRLLLEIESAVDDSVALLALEPDPQRRQVRITGEAKALSNVLAFVARLDGLVSLKHAHLASQDQRNSGGVRVVGFTIVGDWDDTP